MYAVADTLRHIVREVTFVVPKRLTLVCPYLLQVSRRESARITLRGNAEFEASDVTLAGDCDFDVPAGHRMRVAAGPCV